jgi:hypothetical protein
MLKTIPFSPKPQCGQWPGLTVTLEHVVHPNAKPKVQELENPNDTLLAPGPNPQRMQLPVALFVTKGKGGQRGNMTVKWRGFTIWLASPYLFYVVVVPIVLMLFGREESFASFSYWKIEFLLLAPALPRLP